MKYLVIICLSLLSLSASGQVFTNKEVGKKNQAIADSLKKSEYPYSLPIWGAKATKAGYNLPYSAGLSIQYFWAESDLIFDNLMVGFNNNPMMSLDEIVRFDVAKSEASSLTVRPDLWLFPFLNIYGILGKSQASTQVGFQVWNPRTNAPVGGPLSTTIEFNTTTFGLGFTPTVGVGGGFLALDMNVAWTDVPQLSRPARSFVFGPRFGKNFKLKKPERAIAVWAGGFRVQIAGETNGSLPLSEVFPDDGPVGVVVDENLQQIAQEQQDLEDTWNSLTPPQQALLLDVYNRKSERLAQRQEFWTQADQAIEDITNSTVQYSMEKRVKDPWNFIVGTQYQLNKHFMVRAEYGFLGSRNQVITGLQYRFGL